MGMILRSAGQFFDRQLFSLGGHKPHRDSGIEMHGLKYARPELRTFRSAKEPVVPMFIVSHTSTRIYKVKSVERKQNVEFAIAIIARRQTSAPVLEVVDEGKEEVGKRKKVGVVWTLNEVRRDTQRCAANCRSVVYVSTTEPRHMTMQAWAALRTSSSRC
ncbi:hypothetical protein PENSPDRAFT_476587 [Peniophora sp. CONT]|nr:hypothetical protein PENSPDRAFT_476587 [Peniophora sp. CONT]